MLGGICGLQCLKEIYEELEGIFTELEHKSQEKFRVITQV
jgi:hypothetical protein